MFVITFMSTLFVKYEETLYNRSSTIMFLLHCCNIKIILYHISLKEQSNLIKKIDEIQYTNIFYILIFLTNLIASCHTFSSYIRF